MRKVLAAAVVVVLCMTAIAASQALAAEKPLTPETCKGAMVMDDASAKANYGKAKFFDVRKKAEYVESHIAGAISIPYEEKSDLAVNFDSSKDSFDLGKFPSDKNEPIVVYCNGPRCWKSYKAAVLLVKAGYKNVKWYRNDGFPGWKAKGYPVE